MAYIKTSTNFSNRFGLFGIQTVIGNLIADFREEQRKQALYRRTYHELNLLSERELSDLGMARFEIADVAREAVYGR